MRSAHPHRSSNCERPQKPSPDIFESHPENANTSEWNRYFSAYGIKSGMTKAKNVRFSTPKADTDIAAFSRSG
jgi:hypothetical protein